MIRTIYRALVRIAGVVTGDHPDATIFHPQWLAIRRQTACARYAAGFARGVLLDVGCGRKPYLRLFQPRVARYVGVDVPPVADPRGRSEADVFATVEQLPVRNGSVDVVLFTEVLEHLPEPVPVLVELRRVLRRQGVLILTTPMIYNVHGAPHDYLRFTPHGLRRVLELAGFRVVDVRPLGYFGTALGVMINNFLTVLFDRHSLLRAARVTVLLPVLLLVFALANVLGLLLDLTLKGEEFAFDHLALAEPAAGLTAGGRLVEADGRAAAGG